MNDKYVFTGETTTAWDGTTLQRIRRKCDGAIGGWVEAEKNLSVSGAAWVFGDAQVSGAARVFGAAQVFGDARVSGDARVFGDAQVSEPILCVSRSDGYLFVIVRVATGAPHILAGCHDFTLDQARQHWQTARAGTRLGEESLLLVDHLERMAKLAGWL